MVAAHNAHNASAFAACFTDDAVVRDEGRTHIGPAEIRAWFEKVSSQYRMHLRVTDLTARDGEPILHGSVSGDFDGSPADMRYLLALEDGKIVALKIEA